MNYSDKPGMVRVDFFKDTGKWYCTEAVDMSCAWDFDLLADGVYAALAEHLWLGSDQVYRLEGMMAIVLEPYYKNAHPVSLTVDATKLDAALIQRADKAIAAALEEKREEMLKPAFTEDDIPF